MTTIAWLMLIAAALPFLATGIAKAGDKSFDNDNPRAWLQKQEGWRARANAAQTNFFEGLPFFYAAVLFALYRNVDLPQLRNLMIAYVIVRLVYLALYLKGKGTLRSIAWTLGLVINVAILFSGG
ncbi:MAPEG family protein [Schauerella aestuarii]|uniref:MAPEG family protein n=1 Tax=Schauerella aestuarii TaxID=2511204 RepID=UPI00136CA4D5|nr:MAPEG family protein [Achromobacter aestuarii]MYZ41512.1 hypothetical protein [Achromobacter aestuarii]